MKATILSNMRSTFWAEVNATLKTEKLLEVLLQRAKPKKDDILKSDPHLSNRAVKKHSSLDMATSRSISSSLNITGSRSSLDPVALVTTESRSGAIERPPVVDPKASSTDHVSKGWIGKIKHIKDVKGKVDRYMFIAF